VVQNFAQQMNLLRNTWSFARNFQPIFGLYAEKYCASAKSTRVQRLEQLVLKQPGPWPGGEARPA
jgi:hypothetical protein